MGQTTEELNAEIAGTRQSLASDLDALQDRVSPSAIVERRKAAARGRLSQVRSRMMGSVDSASSSTSGATGSAASSVVDSATGVAGAVEDKVEGSPLGAGLVAFGAGMLISALMPPTEAEARASQRLVEAAQPLVDEAKSMGQDMGTQLKDSASQSAQEVKDSAKQSADRVQDEASNSATNVRSQAQS